jgi:hypothetical protein
LKDFGNIRSLYKPVQPLVKRPCDEVVYTEFAPDPKLNSLIFCYWQLKTDQPLADTFYYRVVADGCIDIFFELESPEESFVMGFSKAYTAFPLQASFNYVGVRFLPSAFPQIFRINASELTGRFENLKTVVAPLAEFISLNFDPALSISKITSALDGHFLTLVNDLKTGPDLRLYGAMEIILQKQGILTLDKHLDRGVSSRQLRRLFEFYIGDTAKSFSNVVRFQSLLRNGCAAGRRGIQPFFDAGYYDQAHFIKEFKMMFGATPGRAFDV